MIHIANLSSMKQRVGQELAIGDWVTVDQATIDKAALKSVSERPSPAFGFDVAFGGERDAQLLADLGDLGQCGKRGERYGGVVVDHSSTSQPHSRACSNASRLISDRAASGWVPNSPSGTTVEKHSENTSPRPAACSIIARSCGSPGVVTARP
jgi:hypothetical protein